MTVAFVFVLNSHAAREAVRKVAAKFGSGRRLTVSGAVAALSPLVTAEQRVPQPSEVTADPATAQTFLISLPEAHLRDLARLVCEVGGTSIAARRDACKCGRVRLSNQGCP